MIVYVAIELFGGSIGYVDLFRTEEAALAEEKQWLLDNDIKDADERGHAANFGNEFVIYKKVVEEN